MPALDNPPCECRYPPAGEGIFLREQFATQPVQAKEKPLLPARRRMPTFVGAGQGETTFPILPSARDGVIFRLSFNVESPGGLHEWYVRAVQSRPV